MKNILLVIVAALSLAVLNGCAVLVVGGAAAAGAGTVVYLDGELKDTQSYSLEAVYSASLAGLKDMQFSVVNSSKDTINAKILARTATDTKVQITLTKQSPTLTEIRIRVGTFGDEQMSRQILDKIKAHL